MMDEKYMNKRVASIHFNKFVENGFKYSEKLEYGPIYINLRKKLLFEHQEVRKKYDSEYMIDLHFGLKVYEIMNETFELDKNNNIASNPEFWIYITMEIIPDLTYDRWKINKPRFYDSSKRIWIFSLWWYIHLSWQGSYEETRKTIYDFTTDSIVQIFERSGSGFDFELSREIVRQLNQVNDKGKTLRKVMVLNTVYIKTIEPKLYNGGVKGYVKMLFDKVKS